MFKKENIIKISNYRTMIAMSDYYLLDVSVILAHKQTVVSITYGKLIMIKFF